MTEKLPWKVILDRWDGDDRLSPRPHWCDINVGVQGDNWDCIRSQQPDKVVYCFCRESDAVIFALSWAA